MNQEDGGTMRAPSGTTLTEARIASLRERVLTGYYNRPEVIAALARTLASRDSTPE